MKTVLKESTGMRIYLSANSKGKIRVIGISKEKETKPKLTTRQKQRATCVLILLLVFTLIFIYLLLTYVIYALIWGVFCIIFLVFMALPRDQVPKDLERTKRDIDRRTHFPAGGYGKGLIHFENGGPTHPEKTDEDY